MPQARKALEWLGLGLRYTAAAVWIVAGAAKIPRIQSFHVLVERYDILPHVLAAPFAFILPVLEMAIGVYLVLGLFTRGTALLGTLLFAAFMAAQASAWSRGLALDCGCFGTVAQSTVGPLTVLRDFGLGIPTFLMAAFPARLLSLDARLFGSRDAFGGLGRRLGHTLPKQ